MLTESATGVSCEPRAVTMLDLILGTVGVSCASALPSGLSWFDLRERSTLQGFDLAVSVMIWASCLGAVGLAFAVVGRHAVYKRAARPAEWLVIALAARYLSLAVTELHAEHGSASILVAQMESGLQADIGPLGRLICTGIIFSIIVAYVGVLFRYAGFSPLLRSLLGAAVALLWYWGPCDVWSREISAMMLALEADGILFASVLLPSAPAVALPLVLGYWAVFSHISWRRWTQPELVAMIWFVGTTALLFFHPSVQQYYGSGWFFAQLLVFVVVTNLVAAPLGWSVAFLYRELIENCRVATPEE